MAPADTAPYPPLQRMLADCVLPAISTALRRAKAASAVLLTVRPDSSGCISSRHCWKSRARDRLHRARESDAAARTRPRRSRLPLFGCPSRAAAGRAVTGDIERARFGLEPPAYTALFTPRSDPCCIARSRSGLVSRIRCIGRAPTSLARSSCCASRAACAKGIPFVSSISACYSRSGRNACARAILFPRIVGHTSRMPQTKWVVEALVRAAAGAGPRHRDL